MRAPRGRSAGMADTRIGTMPLSVRYLHLRGHPQTLRAGSENIAHSNDAVGLLRVPVKVMSDIEHRRRPIFFTRDVSPWLTRIIAKH